MTDDVVAALGGLAVAAPEGFTERVLTTVGAADRCAALAGPAGPLVVAWNAAGISLVLAGGDVDRLATVAAQRLGRPVTPAPAPPAEVVAAVRTGDGSGLRYDLRTCSAFERAVLEAALRIPRGQVRTYAEVAREVGRPAAVRAVGNALGRNPVPVLIPCHRVVRSDGRIGNYALGGGVVKRTILGVEGVRVADDGRVLAAAG